MWRFGLSVSSLRLHDAQRGCYRRSLYIALETGRHSLWVQRWLASRDPRPRFIEPRTGMSWSWGAR